MQVIVVERTGRVALVRLVTEAFETWAVRGPRDLDAELTYWTQPSETAARDFYTRLVATLSATPTPEAP